MGRGGEIEGLPPAEELRKEEGEDGELPEARAEPAEEDPLMVLPEHGHRGVIPSEIPLDLARGGPAR